MSGTENRLRSLKSEKYAFYNWVFKWVTNNERIEEANVDTPQIVAILQTLGFKLENVDFTVNNDQISNDDDDDICGSIIEVKCKKSGMRATLSKPSNICICPSLERVNEGHFWAVSGSGPSNSQDYLNRIDETYSTLIPTVTKEKSMLVKDVLIKLFTIIEDSDINQNAHNNTISLKTSRPIFSRQDTWEVDPDTTPPTRTSSPLPELSKSLNQMSLNREKQQILVDILLNLKDNLDKAFMLLPIKDNTFTKANEIQETENIRRNLNPTTPVNVSVDKPSLNRSFTPLPIQKSSEKRTLVVPKRIEAFKKKIEQSTVTTKLSAIPMGKQISLSDNIAVPDRRNSLGSIPKRSGLKTKLNLSANGSGVTKPKTGIPSFGFKHTARTNQKSK